MSKTAVIAFGGNALLRIGQEGFYQEQLANVEETCESVIPLVKAGYKIVIGHGNGPQVGNVLLQHEMANRVSGVVAMPLDFCVAETQGSIGYLIEQGFRNVLKRHGIEKEVLGIITQVVVDQNDPLFVNPTKPIGRYFKQKQMESFIEEHPGTIFREDPKGNGWRRVVASPAPKDILNVPAVEMLANAGHIVITVGGGGVPVIIDNGIIKGVEAVIDKDLSSAL
ncbi:MAG: carbamate kinase, partial [Bacteroidales bacterium]|nr:carbamate kinase [Bacteroidales bacterium]